MNKITKYITTGAATMLMLMSVGAVQTNANAARHYRVHVSRYSKKNIRRGNKRQNKTNQKDNTQVNQQVNNQNAYQQSQQKVQKNQKAKAKKLNKQNKKQVKDTKRNYRKQAHKNAVKKYMKKNKRYLRRHAKRFNRNYNTKAVLKPKYKIVNGNKRGNKALQKSGFVDGSLLVKIGYDPNYAKYIFNKYAPNDKRAVIPSYMNPKMRALNKKIRIADYHNINNVLWVQGYFSLTNPSKDTKNPKVYKYNYKVHGWQLAPRY